MLVKSGTGSISMVSGFVLSPPQPQGYRKPQPNPLVVVLQQLLRRQR